MCFKAQGLKIEAENMTLEGFSIMEDESASSNKYISPLTANANASIQVVFPAGKYEFLARMRAYSNTHSHFSVSINAEETTVYPSNPPLGIWEYTSRVPVTVEFSKETLVEVKLKSFSADSIKDKKVALDYIQFALLP